MRPSFNDVRLGKEFHDFRDSEGWDYSSEASLIAYAKGLDFVLTEKHNKIEENMIDIYHTVRFVESASVLAKVVLKKDPKISTEYFVPDETFGNFWRYIRTGKEALDENCMVLINGKYWVNHQCFLAAKKLVA